MAEYARYYVEFLKDIWDNFCGFFKNFFYAFYQAFILDVGGYFKNLSNFVKTYREDLDAFFWILVVFIGLLHGALIFFVCYRIFQVIRRYVLYRSKEVDKDKLQEEIAILKIQAEKLQEEKNKIFALKVGADVFNAGGNTAVVTGEVSSGLSAGQISGKIEAPVIVASGATAAIPAGRGSRFAKLSILDEKYTKNPKYIFMEAEDMLSLPEIVDRFVNYAASQLKLYYEKNTIRLYFAGLATSKIMILEGISGTGKTSLPYAMSKFFGNNASIISVQPSWRDRAELIGYFNEFTKKFNETDFLASLYEASLREDPNFIVLDEMNLARIEYYFADFLSIMEMPDIAEWKIDIVPDSQSTDPKNIVYGKLLVPQNVWFIGTANNDDSTFTITDKVYDRAIAIELNKKADYFDAPTTAGANCSYAYLEDLFEKALANYNISEKNTALLKELDDFVQNKFKIAFGNRVLKQIRYFVPVYMATGGTEEDALDFMITTKILRKFNSLNLPFLTTELKELITFINKKFGKGTLPYSIEYINELLKLQ